MHSRRKIFYLVGSAVAATTLSRRSYAIDYPLRFVRIVVPFPPGGPNDVLARTIGRRLSELWRQEVIVENKPGGAVALFVGIRCGAISSDMKLSGQAARSIG